jgi:hypothetical protein
MMFKEIIDVYTENHTRSINAPYWQNAELLIVESTCIVTTLNKFFCFIFQLNCNCNTYEPRAQAKKMGNYIYIYIYIRQFIKWYIYKTAKHVSHAPSQARAYARTHASTHSHTRTTAISLALYDRNNFLRQRVVRQKTS